MVSRVIRGSGSGRIPLISEIEGIFHLKYFSISNTLYNVTVNNNRIVTDSGTVTLIPGHYTYDSLRGHLETVLQGIDGGCYCLI